MSSIPTPHIAEATKLDNVEPYVDLYKLQLIDGGFLYFQAGLPVTWQSNVYEPLAFRLEGTKRSTDSQISRPKLMMYQVEGLFSPFVYSGKLEGSILIRKRVLSNHIDSDTNVFQESRWMISRVTTLVAEAVGIELRQLSDGPNFTMPPRMFITPEFPSVMI